MSIILVGREHHALGLDRVLFSINGKPYEYDCTADVANRVDEVAKYKPGKALSIAKKNGALVEKKKDWIRK